MHSFSAKTKPFRCELDSGGVINGFWDLKADTFARYTKPIPVKKHDVFYHDRKRGLILNGKPVQVKLLPAKKCPVRIGRVARKLRVAVFLERDEIWNRRTRKPTGRFGKPYWCAMDTSSYWVGTGDSVEVALSRLIEAVKLAEKIAQECKKNGKKVIRWHQERSPEAQKEIRDAEKKAKKRGFVLDGIDWREF